MSIHLKGDLVIALHGSLEINLLKKEVEETTTSPPPFTRPPGPNPRDGSHPRGSESSESDCASDPHPALQDLMNHVYGHVNREMSGLKRQVAELAAKITEREERRRLKKVKKLKAK